MTDKRYYAPFLHKIVDEEGFMCSYINPLTKPEETENFIRIPVRSACEVTATLTIDKEKGITALYCGKIKEIRTYLFNKKVYPWTMEKAKKWVEEHHKPKKEEGNMKMIRKFIDFEIKDVDEEDRSFLAVASTGIKDRDGDILEPTGWKLKNFRTNPVVLWAHDYRGLPIARATDIKVEDNKLMFRPQFATKEIYPFADTVFQLYKNKYLRTFSVGFIPLKFEDIEEEEEGKQCGPHGRKFTSQELLEISGCPVPSNVEALAERTMADVIAKSFGLVIPDEKEEYKGAIPYKETGKESEDAGWDAGMEVRQAEVEDLKIMCAWVNSEEPDLKTSYKLPHHKAKGHNVVWRGVAAAMGALLGARGGVQIPAGDKRGVYNHLAKHYKQFDKEPPEMREYSEPELREMFDDIWYEELGDIITMEMENADIEAKSGRVLSEKNRSIVKKCIDALTELFTASEPQEEGGKELTEEEKKRREKLAEEVKALGEIIKGGN